MHDGQGVVAEPLGEFAGEAAFAQAAGAVQQAAHFGLVLFQRPQTVLELASPSHKPFFQNLHIAVAQRGMHQSSGLRSWLLSCFDQDAGKHARGIESQQRPGLVRVSAKLLVQFGARSLRGGHNVAAAAQFVVEHLFGGSGLRVGHGAAPTECGRQVERFDQMVRKRHRGQFGGRFAGATPGEEDQVRRILDQSLMPKIVWRHRPGITRLVFHDKVRLAVVGDIGVPGNVHHIERFLFQAAFQPF